MEIGCRRIYVDDIVAICQIFHKRLDYYLFGIEKDTPNTYFIRVFSELSKEDQIEVLNYIEFRHQLSEEPIDPQTIFYQLYSNKE